MVGETDILEEVEVEGKEEGQVHTRERVEVVVEGVIEGAEVECIYIF